MGKWTFTSYIVITYFPILNMSLKISLKINLEKIIVFTIFFLKKKNFFFNFFSFNVFFLYFLECFLSFYRYYQDYVINAALRRGECLCMLTCDISFLAFLVLVTTFLVLVSQDCADILLLSHADCTSRFIGDEVNISLTTSAGTRSYFIENRSAAGTTHSYSMYNVTML